MRLFVSALEYSANIHLKYLLREMITRENIELCGIFDESILDFANGESAPFCVCGESLCDISEVAVMGFINVLKKANFFLQLRAKCLNIALSSDKILLMDSSSFNIPLAKRVKKRDSRKEIMYYILPQVWAWKPWRAKVIEANCDKLAAILPFEVGCYKQRAKFVGHPLLDEIRQFREINSSLGASCGDLANFECSQTTSLVSHSKFAKNTTTSTANTRICDLNQGDSSDSNATESSLRGVTDAEAIQNKNQSARSANRISPDSWCKKSESKGAVVPPADFLLESDKRGTPPKSEKAAAFWRVGGAGQGVQPFLRKETNETKRQSVDCFGDESPRNDDIFLDSSLTSFAQNDDSVDCHEILTQNLAMTSDSDIFTFMPGSRLGEINRIFPIFLQVKDMLKKRDSKAKFHLVVPKKFSTKNLSEIYGDTSDFIITFDAHTSLLQSKFAFICSGTATLECALIGTPFVLGYQGRAIEAFVVKQFLNIRFVGLANLLYSHIEADSQFHIELLQENLTAQNLLDSYHSANPNDFLQKSLALRAYLKNGSARAVAKWLLEK